MHIPLLNYNKSTLSNSNENWKSLEYISWFIDIPLKNIDNAIFFAKTDFFEDCRKAVHTFSFHQKDLLAFFKILRKDCINFLHTF